MHRRKDANFTLPYTFIANLLFKHETLRDASLTRTEGGEAQSEGKHTQIAEIIAQDTHIHQCNKAVI